MNDGGPQSDPAATYLRLCARIIRRYRGVAVLHCILGRSGSYTAIMAVEISSSKICGDFRRTSQAYKATINSIHILIAAEAQSGGHFSTTTPVRLL